MASRKPVTHGTYSGYAHYGCRCENCKSAFREYVRQARRRRSEKEPPRHGTVSGYTNYLCRCELCANAWRERSREYGAMYRQRHRERLREYSRQYRKKLREQRLAEEAARRKGCA